MLEKVELVELVKRGAREWTDEPVMNLDSQALFRSIN